MKSRKWKEKESREVVHPGLGGNLYKVPPGWQPRVLTTTPCPIHKNPTIQQLFYYYVIIIIIEMCSGIIAKRSRASIF